MANRVMRTVRFFDHSIGEWRKVTALVDEDYICKNPECNRITSSRARSRNGKKQSYCPKCKPKKEGEIEMQNTKEEKPTKWRMLVCGECGFELPDTHRLRFAQHQSTKLHYGIETYETDVEPNIEDLLKEDEDEEE